MIKAGLGIKRTCSECGARFYDMKRPTIVCPKCTAPYRPESKPKFSEVAKPTPKPPVKKTAGDQDDFEDDADDLAAFDEEDGDAVLDDDDDDVIEDPSELGEDDDDMAEAMEGVSAGDDRDGS